MGFLKRCKVTFQPQIMAGQVVCNNAVLAVSNTGLSL